VKNGRGSGKKKKEGAIPITGKEGRDWSSAHYLPRYVEGGRGKSNPFENKKKKMGGPPWPCIPNPFKARRGGRAKKRVGGRFILGGNNWEEKKRRKKKRMSCSVLCGFFKVERGAGRPGRREKRKKKGPSLLRYSLHAPRNR